VLVIPGVILALVTAHLFLMFHQKHTQMPGKGRTNENVVGAPLYPYFMAKTGAFFFFTFAAITLAATFTQINPIWLYGPFNPVAMSAGSQPDFYMGMLEGALRVMPAWQWAPWGHTFAFNVFIPALLPLGALFTGAALWPFIEQWVTGDKREHHINDRPRNAPTRTAIGIAVITVYGILWAEGANDILADHLDVPLYWITWAARVGIFVGPVIAYILTKRICLGLQRKDNHLIEHGVETGIIRQLPGGEFIEETRPVDEDRLAVLHSRKWSELPQLPPGETVETAVPAPGMRGALGKVRQRLYKVAAESTELPTTNGHHNGHGTGHAIEGSGHDGHSVGSGSTATATQAEPRADEDQQN
jgi:ubiquinol-cytochrome c reductase cytochrome b subunit